MHYQGRRQGNVQRGQITVGVTMILTLIANAIIYRQTTITPYAVPDLQPFLIASYMWMFVGAIALCMRKLWGRYLMQLVLYAAVIIFLFVGFMALTSQEVPVAQRVVPMAVGALIYLAAGIAITCSKHVFRITRRTWD